MVAHLFASVTLFTVLFFPSVKITRMTQACKIVVFLVKKQISQQKLTRGQRILTRGHITGGGRFS